MSLSSRTRLSLNMGSRKPGTPLIGPAVPWRCRRCRGPVKPGRVECESCTELRLEWTRDAELDEDARESDNELAW